MCGIVGYAGNNQALPVLLDGLKRLEYRGYDSSGVAVFSGGKIRPVKAVGRISELEKKLDGCVPPEPGPAGRVNIGIAHTRWATHGLPSEPNAHPHCDCSGNIWLAHNGIIENYQQLKKYLEDKGHRFASETDTEVIAHLLEDLYAGDLTAALRKALPLLRGTFGLVVIDQLEPEKMLAAKQGSPLVIGLAENETIVASDVSAILRYTKQVIYLDDGEIAEIDGKTLKIFDQRWCEVAKIAELIEWDLGQAEKQGFDHFMRKEIFEQPEAILNSTRGRYLKKEGQAILGGLDGVSDRLRAIDRIVIVACGTARNAGLVAEHMFEEYAGIPTEVDYASEFRYRHAVLDEKTAVLAISQSGETADTLAALAEAKEKGCLTLGIVNVVGSSIARLTDAGIYNHIGPEIAVASTKAFTSQLSILALLAIKLGRQRKMSQASARLILEEIDKLPEKIRWILEREEAIKEIAWKYHDAVNFAFLGRKYNFPVAVEGAIKLKEVSYIHAEGFAAGEMKHGPIAMIDENFPSLFIAPADSVYEKNLSNMEEIRSRNGRIIAITTAGDERAAKVADDIISIPGSIEMLCPILSAIPLQLFAYHVACFKGLDVDKPRNLAKSVTVE
jgi:glucosamine--fructose-6-phosphate aminotransferase (isomerizing)